MIGCANPSAKGEVPEKRITNMDAVQFDFCGVAVRASIRQLRGGQVHGSYASFKCPIKVDGSDTWVQVSVRIHIPKTRANVPKPWFQGHPGADGSYGDDRIDADVFFWKRWRDAGNSIYIDPGCRLGHLEELVTYFDRGMKLKHVYINDWELASETTAD